MPDPASARFPLQIRFGDIDAYGHVNNATYFSYFEHGRVRLQQLPADPARPDGPTIRDLAGRENFTLVAGQEIEYLLPLTLRPEPVYIDVWVTRVGGSSFRTGYSLAGPDGSPVYALGAATMVLVDRASGHPVPLPDAYRAALQRFAGPEVPFRRVTQPIPDRQQEA
ncbi:acyl-CoA thioesterase [Arthrobacter sp. I2-34]|uniref:Acyl-CoA thioesterase n=1 Tax=Arthrobacter hankyongi TaxID=2904801 RepID=A0ABS9LDH4_9MICC|nr:thioesterase family protein [Arthrobacter hankyongi]MCG2624673.1 acyl-CoA thioesterase [Arthrobacter hankyongi]